MSGRAQFGRPRGGWTLTDAPVASVTQQAFKSVTAVTRLCVGARARLLNWRKAKESPRQSFRSL